MSSLNSIMDTSLTSMFAARAGLSSSSHNIANTPGYNRQETLFKTRYPQMYPWGSIGRGVEIDGIRRIQDQFLVTNLRSQSSKMEHFSQIDNALYEIESILGSVDNDHLGNSLNTFFNAWSDLSTAPFDVSLKQAVKSAADSLVTDFHTISTSIDDLEANIEDSVEMEITKLNELLSQVAEMNSQIMHAESGGMTANDLRDQRDLLVTEISKIAKVSILERDDGTQDVILAGRTLVVRDHAEQFQYVSQKVSTGYEMTVVTYGNLRQVQLSPGRLDGLLTSRDDYVTDVRDQLDSVAAQLAQQVNDLHVQGNSGTTSGLQFFTGDTAHTIDISQIIRDDPSTIATSRTGLAGDNDIALEIAALTNESGGAVGSLTIGDTYRGVLMDVASNRSQFDFLVENQNNVINAIETKIASISGVSLDEEGANMIKFQNTYSAAARVITTCQDMFETMLNMTR